MNVWKPFILALVMLVGGQGQQSLMPTMVSSSRGTTMPSSHPSFMPSESISPSSSQKPSVLPSSSSFPSFSPSFSPSFVPTASTHPSFAPSISSAPTSCDGSKFGRVQRGAIGSAAGFLHFLVVYLSDFVKNTIFRTGISWADGPNNLAILLASVVFGLAVAYLGREATDEELCNGSNGAFVTDAWVDITVLFMSLAELVFELICCCSCQDKEFEYLGFKASRLLGPHVVNEARTCRWWTITVAAFFFGFFAMVGFVRDSITSDHGWWVAILFGLWEVSVFSFCICAAFKLVDRVAFPFWTASTTWAAVKLLMIDGPGLVASLSGIGGELVPIIVQGLVELVLQGLEHSYAK